MKDNHQSLDQFFAESLKGFRQKTPIHAWKRLEADLLMARRHRQIILYRWTAAAAVLLIAIVTGYFVTTYYLDNLSKENTFSQSEIPVTDQPSGDKIHENEITTSSAAETAQPDFSLSSEKSSETVPGIKSPSATSTVPDHSIQQEITVTLQPDEPKEDIAIAQAAENEPEEPAVVEQETPDIQQPEQKNILTEPLPDFTWKEDMEKTEVTSRWSIGGSFAPVYAYRNIHIDAEELPPDVNPSESYYDDSEQGIYSYSGGVDIVYHVKDKWEFQTGLYLSNMGHVNGEVIAYEVEGVKDLLKVSSSTGVIDIITTKLPEEFVDNSIRRDSITGAAYINSNIHQSFTYLELPLLIRYSLLEKRLGLHFTGGLSPGIMTDYRAQFTYEGERIDLQNEGDFYTMIYNSQVGFGMNYTITKSLSINLDPTFKYSLNSIRKDHSIQYHPYSISIFTGVRYSF